jgi:CysZ protein
MPDILSRRFYPASMYVVRGGTFLWSNRVLWRYAAFPLMIGAAILTGAYALLYYIFFSVLSTYSGPEWYWQILYYVLLVVLSVALIVIFFFVFARIASALSSPFNDLLSQKTEELVKGGFSQTQFSFVQLFKDSARSVAHSFKILGIYLGLLICSLVLLLIPGMGGFLFTAVGTLLSAFMFSYEYIGYSMDRRRYTWDEKKAFLRKHFRKVMGFGLGNVIMASIPILNLFFISAAVVGGTLLYLDLTENSRRSEV